MALRFFNSLFTDRKNTIGLRIFINIIAIYFIFRFFTEFPRAEFLYSTGVDFIPGYSRIALTITLFCSLALLAGKYVNIALFFCLASFWYLSDTSNAGDGGDNILRIVMLYLIFIDSKIFKNDYKPGNRIFIHNLAVYAVLLQVMILYFVSGTVKMQGESWYQGTAMYYVLATQQFGPGMEIVNSLFKNAWITSILSHLTMIYQVGFPFMIYNRFHLVWAAIGIAFHVGIAITMGLFTFSLIMIGLILFTISDAEWVKIGQFFHKLNGLIRISALSNHLLSIRSYK